MTGAQETFISHLVELRNRLLHALAAIGIVFVALVGWALERGYLQASIEYGLRHPDIGGDFARYLKSR